MALRVLFAEDNYLVRAGTAALLAQTAGIEVVRTVADAPSLLRAVAADLPDAVLTDIRMPPTNTTEGIEAARRIRADYPRIGVVVLSGFVEHSYAFELLRDGVAGLGYLLKERVAEADELGRALHEVARGGSVLDPKVVEGLLAHTTGAGRGPLARLTPREHEVLREMSTGKNNAAIARTLFLSERAIEKNINSLFHKLDLTEEADAHRRVRAVLAFLEAGGAGG